MKAFSDSFLFSGKCISKIFPIKIRGITHFYLYRSAGIIQIITRLTDLVLVQNDITVRGTVDFRHMRTGIAVIIITGIQKSGSDDKKKFEMFIYLFHSKMVMVSACFGSIIRPYYSCEFAHSQ